MFDDGLDDEEEILVTATRLLVRAALQVREEDAATALRSTTGLRLTPLWPPSEVIQVVSLDGVHIGRVDGEHPRIEPARWVAVGTRHGGRTLPCGPFRTALLAAQALAAQSPRRERSEGEIA